MGNIIKKFDISSDLEKLKNTVTLAKNNENISNIKVDNISTLSNPNDVEEIDCSLVDFNSNKFNSYIDKLGDFSDFTDCMNGDYIKIPIGNTNFIPQGSCQVGDYTLLVGYSSVSGENSTLYVIDKNGNVIKNITLDGSYHCGAVSYDANINNIYITGESGADGGLSSYINQYDLKDILNNNGEELVPDNKIQVDNNNSLKSSTNGKSSVAYLTVNDGYLYAGNFDKEGNGIFKKFQINSDGSLGKETIIKNSFKKTQGMCVYNYNGTDYYMISCSGGRKNDSNIYVSTMDENGNLVKCGEITLPCMVEQISNCGDNGISVLFESCAGEYCDSANQTIDDICYLDPEKILLKSGAIDSKNMDVWMENGNFDSGMATM